MDWDKIKTEYITSNISYRKLAEKYGVPFTTLRCAARKGDWFKLRQGYRDNIVTKAVKEAEKTAIKYKSTIYDLAFKVSEQLEQLINEHPLAALVALGLKPRDITGAIKDIEDILHIKSESDIKEQEARIKNLQKQAEDESRDEKAVTINICGGDKSWQE